MRIFISSILIFIWPLISGCSTTSIKFSPDKPISPICQAQGEQSSALVLWTPKWRPDQKDVYFRESAAQQGITQFFSTSKCFTTMEIYKIPSTEITTTERLQQISTEKDLRPDRILVIEVHELGPILKLLSSIAIIEGGTEVVLKVSEYRVREDRYPLQVFSTHWSSGGPGVIKGVASLPADMEAALAASLMPKAQ